MKVKSLHKLIVSVLFISIVVTPLACGSGQNNEPSVDPPSTQIETAANQQEVLPGANGDDSPEVSDRPPLSGTLTISQLSTQQHLNVAISRFTALHPDVEIVLNTFENDFQRFNMQVPTQLMAGAADDIIEVGALPLFDLADRGKAVDLLPLMQNDPDFNEDDFFMNVLNAFKYRGGLYAFPMTFSYEVTGINTFSLYGVNSGNSEEIIERFSRMGTISFRQMLDLYLGIEDRAGLFLKPKVNALSYIRRNLNDFIDFENNTANFLNDEFIRTLNDWKEVTDPQLIAGGRLPVMSGFTGVCRCHETEFASRYLFADYGMALSYDVFFPHAEQELFTHFIPVATDDGEILVGSGRIFFINSASGNVELAWEFLKFLATDPDVYFGWPLGIPTNREVFRNTIAHPINNAVGVWAQQGRYVDGEIEEITKSIFERVSAFNEMPMRHSTDFWGDHSVMLEEIITSFYRGVLTAEQAAEQLQNRISLFLMERG